MAVYGTRAYLACLCDTKLASGRKLSQKRRIVATIIKKKRDLFCATPYYSYICTGNQ